NQHLQRALGAVAAGTNTDEAAFRRVRLELGGTIYERTIFKIELDFAGGIVAFRDVFVGLKYGTKESSCAGTLRFGSVVEPGMLNRATGDLYITFLERPMLVVFHPDYSAGIATDGGYRVDGVERFTWNLGVFRDVGTSGNDVGAGRNGKYNWSLRLTGLPLYDDGKTSGTRKLLHFGGMLSLRNPNTFTAGVQTVAFATRPDTNFGPTLVNTGNVPAESELVYGLELAGAVDRLWAEAEYVSVATRKPSGLAGPNASFSGYYVSAGLFFTGESRGYKTATGAWDRIKPLHNAFTTDAAGNVGAGAWEFAVRYDVLDLEDTPAGVFGGQLTAVTGALNWYPNPNTRVMFNYTYADLQQKLASPPNNSGAEQIATFRFQVDL
ncbi:MAG TPA: porin, partial [Planctomycetota bacterium]|nr:porin [Planctomycetota bacterium]